MHSLFHGLDARSIRDKNRRAARKSLISAITVATNLSISHGRLLKSPAEAREQSRVVLFIIRNMIRPRFRRLLDEAIQIIVMDATGPGYEKQRN